MAKFNPTKCKHAWGPPTFVGEPHQWAAKIVETCKCGKTKERAPTYDESVTEHNKITCPTCGYKHTTGRGGEGCIEELAQKIVKLEDRMDTIFRRMRDAIGES